MKIQHIITTAAMVALPLSAQTPAPAASATTPVQQAADFATPEEAPTAKFMKQCVVILDFSQASISPINTKERYELKSFWKIDFHKGKIESTAFGHSIDVGMPSRRYVRNKINGQESIPKITAWACYYDSGVKKDAPELIVIGSSIPDEEGDTDDMESFSLDLLLSFIDQTHAEAKGSLQVNITGYGNYKAKVDKVKIIIQNSSN